MGETRRGLQQPAHAKLVVLDLNWNADGHGVSFVACSSTVGRSYVHDHDRLCGVIDSERNGVITDDLHLLVSQVRVAIPEVA